MSSSSDNEIPVPRVLLPDNTEIGFNQVSFNEPVDVKHKPSFSETLGANFSLFNDIYRAPQLITSAFHNPVADPEYNPLTSGLLDKVRPEDRARVINTSSFYEGNAVVKRLNEEYRDKDIRDRSGWFANLTTTLGSAFFSPTTLIPISQTVKYGTVGAGAFKNAMNVTKSVVPAVALQNAVLVGTKETEGYKDWIHDTLIESFLGASIGGALGAFAAKGTQKNFGKVKAAFSSVEEDIGVKYLLGKDGETVGAEAYLLPGGSGSADRVRDINKILESVNPFEKNPYTKAFFGWAQPIMKGLTNRFHAVRDLTDDLFAHNFEVAGGDITKIKGLSAENLKRTWNSQLESVSLQQKDDYFEHIGVTGFLENTKATIGEWKGTYIAEKEYNELVGKSIRRNGETGVATVDRSAKRWIKEIYDPLLEELKKRRPDITEHEFTNIKRYLNRIADKEKIQQDPVGFLNEYQTFLGEVNNKVYQWQRPLDTLTLRNKNIKKRLSFLNENIKPSSEFLPHPEQPSLSALKSERRALRRELNENIRNKRRIQADIDERIKNGEIDLPMLEDKPPFTPEQVEQIEKLREPRDKAESEFNAALKEYRKTTNKEAKAKAREEVKKKREALHEEKSKLRRTIAEEDLDPNIWWKKTSAMGDIVYGLRNPKRVKLAKVMSEGEIRTKAQRTMDTYLQQNEEQTLSQLFETITEKGTSVLRERTVLWNDARAEKWLVNDIETLGRAYVNQMVPRIHLDDVFLRHGETPKKGQEVIASKLKTQYDNERFSLLAKEQTPEVKKQIKKLDKDYKDAKEFTNKMYKTFLGDLVDRSATSYRITNAIKEMGAASLLGNLPILQLTEFFTPLFKFTFNEYISDGLMPMLRYWNQLKRTGKVDRAAFQDAGVGLNVALGKRIQSIMGYGAQSQPKTVMERYIKNMVGLSHNLSLANYITDFQETMVAFMSQAKTMRLLEKLKGESLAAKDIAYLDVQRINPNKVITLPNKTETTLGKQMLEQMRKHGDQVEGGWVPNWHLWDKEAFEAQQAFRGAIEKEARSLITKPNALDVPFSFKENQIMSLATQFLSFPFAATLNFTIPIMTKPDAQKFIGLLTTMAAASMVDPLRQLAKGQDVELDADKLATSAFVNSGFYGWQLDAIQRLNAAVDLPFLRPFQGDRFRRKTPWELLGGPASGMLTNMASLLSGAVNGDVTQRDLKNAVRYTIPFAYNWYLQQPINAMIEATGVPERRESRG